MVQLTKQNIMTSGTYFVELMVLLVSAFLLYDKNWSLESYWIFSMEVEIFFCFI